MELSKEEDGPEIDFNDIFSLRRPKDAAAGFSSGLKSYAKGIVGGAVGLVAAPVIGAQRDGIAGFAKGLATGVAGAVVLPVTGVAVGTVQMFRGVANTPEALAEAGKGKTWDQEQRQWVETPDGAIVTAESARFAKDQVRVRTARLSTARAGPPRVVYLASLQVPDTHGDRCTGRAGAVLHSAAQTCLEVCMPKPVPIAVPEQQLGTACLARCERLCGAESPVHTHAHGEQRCGQLLDSCRVVYLCTMCTSAHACTPRRAMCWLQRACPCCVGCMPAQQLLPPSCSSARADPMPFGTSGHSASLARRDAACFQAEGSLDSWA
eukprot:361427-Chlamydomonas_euryale.AAC.6